MTSTTGSNGALDHQLHDWGCDGTDAAARNYGVLISEGVGGEEGLVNKDYGLNPKFAVVIAKAADDVISGKL